MKINISDLLDQYPAEDVELGGETPYSPSRIKELTMKEIKTDQTGSPRRFKPIRLLAVAVAAAALSVSALAAGQLIKAGDLFQGFFTPEAGSLSQGQVEAIDRLGQVLDGEHSEVPAAVTSNGATITPLAALADENVYYLRLRVEAPEGTALPDLDGEHHYQLFSNDGNNNITLKADEGAYPRGFGYEMSTTVLPDDEPNDNRKELVLCITAQYGDRDDMKFNDGVSKILTIHGLWVQDAYKGYTPIFTGEFQFDIGLSFQSQTVSLDVEGVSWTDEVLDYTNTLKYMTISPLSLSYCYSTTLPDNQYFGPKVSFEIVLKDGTAFVPGFDTTQDIVDYLKGWHDLDPEDILPLSGPAGQDIETYFLFDEPLDLSQVDHVTFGDVKIPVGVE